jgi:hypothetical protein
MWMGTVEVRSTRDGNEVLGAAKGAFVSIVTWAADAESYKYNAELVIEGLGGLLVVDVLNAEPVNRRRTRTSGHFTEDIEDLISRAEANPNAILYGTFYTYRKDDA